MLAASRRHSLMATLLLILSFANLAFVFVAFVRSIEPNEDLEPASPKTNFFGTLALVLVSAGQLLYLLLFAASKLHWSRFYRGNPVETYSIKAGIILSIGAFLVASAGNGLKRLAAMVVAVTTGFLWLLAAVASAAV